MNNYEKMAENILQKMGVKFNTKYLTHDYYFTGDKDTRDIYRASFKRNGKSFSLRFGQSIAATGTHPRAYDVLACIQKYDVGDFENFCGDFGYDTDSRTAERTYKAVLKKY